MNLFPEQVPNEKSSPWSVSEFTSRVKYTLESTIAYCWIQGEVSNLRLQSSGHAYFSLKDSGSQVSCVLFRGNRARNKVELRDGMELILGGELSVYEPRGSYQIIAREIIESGAGRLQIEFERLKNKLKKEGLFDAAHKKAFPRLPQRIAVITSPSGAALQDFIEILKRRKYCGEVNIYPSLMQGEQAAGTVCTQLDLIEKVNDADLVVITRGGGSIEDLWAFNDEKLARRIAECQIPVVSAIGHEIDFTLADFVSDFRAETPSGAAELISSAYLEQVSILEDCEISLSRTVEQFLGNARSQIDFTKRNLLFLSPDRRIEQLWQKIDDIENTIHRSAKENTRKHLDAINQMTEKLARFAPQTIIEQERKNLSTVEKNLLQQISYNVKDSEKMLHSLEQRLQNCSHLKVLQRGYAMVEDEENNIMSSAQSVQLKDKINIRFADGVIQSTPNRAK